MRKMVDIMTNKQQKMVYAVTHSDNESLHDVYKSFSVHKSRVYDNCLHEMARRGGFCFRITTHNTSFFSCGFLYYDENKRLKCRYYTGRRIYDFIVK